MNTNYRLESLGIIEPFLIRKITDILIKSCMDSSIYLVGSYSKNLPTKSSDLDFLMVVDKKKLDSVVEITSKSINNLDIRLIKKIDCKIISRQDLSNYRNQRYLMLYSMVTNGKLLHGKPIKVVLDLDKLKNELERMITELNDIENHFLRKLSCEIMAKYIFSLGKSFNYLDKIIDPQEYYSLKDIWKKNLLYIGSLYEKNQSKGITTSFNIPIFGKSQKNVDYQKMKICYEQLNQYGKSMQEKFLKYYKKNG